ncbi:MAG: transcription antitermination factor NusB [Phycisphaerales bacterium]|nr:transcription antitermination factor NusB [Phycisphaerales bacterium]
MATPRDIRRLAFQILYQLDARGGGSGEGEAILAGFADDEDESTKYTEGERKKALLLASAAYADRAAADAFMTEQAPTWPAHRQAAVDRAILRLAHHEMISGKTHPKIAVNEAVELAKTFSTEKSPSFINGLLDKTLKKVLGDQAEVIDPSLPPPAGPDAAAPTEATQEQAN